MAQNVKPSSGVLPKIGGKRGRPTKAETEARKAAAAAAEATIAAAGSKPRTEPAPAAPAVAPKPGKPKDQAPGFGHNAPDEAVFLKHVHAIQQHVEGPVAQAKAKLKEENGRLKDLRQLAKADGLVLKELDEAVEDARTERVDLVAKEQRRRLYRQWLGLPMEQGDLFEEDTGTPSLAREQLRWKAQGNTDGRLGRPRVSPEGCPPNMDSHYYTGWEEGQAALLRSSPLTAGAFNKDGTVKPATPAADQAAATPPAEVGTPAPAPEKPQPAAEAVIVLGPSDFTPETTDLQDANRSTIFDDRTRERFDAAERVVAVFAGKRRILKEPGYVDDGAAETALSDVEEAAEAEVKALAGDGSALAALAEAEPEIVEQVIADHGGDEDEEETVKPVDELDIPGERPITKPTTSGGEFH